MELRDSPEFLHTQPQIRPEFWWPSRDTDFLPSLGDQRCRF